MHTNGANNAGEAHSGCLGIDVQGAKVFNVGRNLALMLGFGCL